MTIFLNYLFQSEMPPKTRSKKVTKPAKKPADISSSDDNEVDADDIGEEESNL